MRRPLPHQIKGQPGRFADPALSLDRLHLDLGQMPARDARRCALAVASGLAEDLKSAPPVQGAVGAVSVPPLRARPGESPESLGRRIAAAVASGLRAPGQGSGGRS